MMDIEYRRTKLWRILEDVCYNTHPIITDGAKNKARDLRYDDDEACKEMYNAISTAYAISHVNLIERGFRAEADKIAAVLDMYRHYDK